MSIMAEIYCCLLGHLQGSDLDVSCHRSIASEYQNDRVVTVKHGLCGLFRANEEQAAEITEDGKGVKITGKMS
jgi:hypothetical protein